MVGWNSRAGGGAGGSEGAHVASATKATNAASFFMLSPDAGDCESEARAPQASPDGTRDVADNGVARDKAAWPACQTSSRVKPRHFSRRTPKAQRRPARSKRT